MKESANHIPRHPPLNLFMHALHRCAPPRRRQSGFSLVEIMFVVVIISLLALLALPAFTKVRRNAQSNRFISDLRTFTQAFEGFASMNGSFPANAFAGVVPVGMEEDLKTPAWKIVNSLGGRWNWDNLPAGGKYIYLMQQ
jgi:prepilin-type N-terminal cleavage/methylation domain-containing protein